MTDEQRAIMMMRYADTRTEVLAQQMGVGYYTVSHWAKALGLTKSEAFRKEVSSAATAGFNKRYGCRVGKPRHIELDDEKREYMRKHFAVTLTPVLAQIMGVNVRTVRRWAKAMGLQKDAEVIQMHRTCRQRPTPEQWFQTVATVSELYPDGRDEEAARLTGYCKQYIGEIARKYHISRSPEYMQSAKENVKSALIKVHRKFSPELIASIAEYFPTHTDRECADKFGLTKPSIQYLARKYGMQKATAHLDMIHLSNITAAKAAKIRNNKTLKNGKIEE